MGDKNGAIQLLPVACIHNRWHFPFLVPSCPASFPSLHLNLLPDFPFLVPSNPASFPSLPRHLPSNFPCLVNSFLPPCSISPSASSPAPNSSRRQENAHYTRPLRGLEDRLAVTIKQRNENKVKHLPCITSSSGYKVNKADRSLEHLPCVLTTKTAGSKRRLEIPSAAKYSTRGSERKCF